MKGMVYTMTTKTTGFDFIADTTETSNNAESRKLQHTNRLIDLSKARAVEIMKHISKASAEDKSLLIAMIDSGKAEDLITLIDSAINSDDQVKDSEFLADCKENEFSKLLESRRSDRSKKFKLGARANVTNCQNYIAAMYAEVLIRKAWNKPYASSSQTALVDESDLEAIKKKVKSLQSKKCRLAKTAEFVEADKIELTAVTEEIARLNSFRPAIVSKTMVKSADAETVRNALKLIDPSQLDENVLAQLKVAGLL